MCCTNIHFHFLFCLRLRPGLRCFDCPWDVIEVALSCLYLRRPYFRQTSAPIYISSSLNCSSLCGLQLKPKSDFRGVASDIPSQTNMTVNFGGHFVRKSRLSTGNSEKNPRRFLQLFEKDYASFNSRKSRIVYRGPNEAELARFWNGRLFHNLNKGETNLYMSLVQKIW